jgi:uncharacterized protein (TIGR02058 family)
MSLKRMVLQIGMGTDIRGADYTKAAVRALRDALWHNSLSVANALGQPVDAMRVAVTIGVPHPELVDREAVLAVLDQAIAAGGSRQKLTLAGAMVTLIGGRIHVEPAPPRRAKPG